MKAIVLIGMSGAGKSTTAKFLSAKINKKYIDIDTLIEKQENLDISSIFTQKGEVYFRNLEKEILKQYSTQENIIIATGGGAFENKETRDILLEKTYVIYLETSENILFERIKNEKNRPLLINNPQESIEKLLNKRRKNYKLAHFTILTDNKTTEQIANEIIKCVNLK